MSPPSTALVLQHLDREIAFFNDNTDALVVDVMRNPGGLVSFVEAISQRFMTAPFNIDRLRDSSDRRLAVQLRVAAELRARSRVRRTTRFSSNLQRNFDEVLSAFNENRGRSAPVSLNATGSLTLDPAPVRYSKPMIVLTDEFSASGADMFPAIIQDNGRAPLVGMRTMGAGGRWSGIPCTPYTESICRITVSLMNRGRLIQTPEHPAGAIHREHRRAPGHRARLHDARESHDGGWPLRAGVHAGAAGADAVAASIAAQPARRGRDERNGFSPYRVLVVTMCGLNRQAGVGHHLSDLALAIPQLAQHLARCVRPGAARAGRSPAASPTS